MKALLICNTSPFKIKDGVSAALRSLFDTIYTVYDDVDVYIVSTNLFYIDTNKSVIRDFSSLSFNIYDVVFVSPITAMLLSRKYLSKKRGFLIICQISDCMVYELWRSFVLSFKYKNINILPIFKIPYYYFKEFQVRNMSDSVLLQTEKDVSIFNRLYFTSIGESFPNINLDLDKNMPINMRSVKENSIGWCATFEGEYLRLAKWFFKEVIFIFLSSNKKAFLSLVGKNNNNFYLFLILNYPELKDQIHSNNYVHDIASFNASNIAVISPVFKGYGLINKTIEAMASGAVVIGDKSAFNGIKNCVSYRDCIIAEKVDEFIISLDIVFNKLSDLELHDIGLNAKNLIYDQFKKENNVKKIVKIIKKIKV